MESSQVIIEQTNIDINNGSHNLKMRENRMWVLVLFLIIQGSVAYSQTKECPSVEINKDIVKIKGESSNGRVFMFFEEGFAETEIRVRTNDSTFHHSMNTINDLGYAYHIELGDFETVDQISLSINGCDTVDLKIRDRKHGIFSINLIDNFLHVGYYDKLPSYE